MAEKNIVLNTETDLKLALHHNYMKQIENFFGDKNQALKFLSSVMADVQKNPTLLACEPASIINSYLTMAQLKLMPSGVSGEAYVLPYAKNKKNGSKWESTMIAQFQLGYQGLITLFYRAGGTRIRTEIIRKSDVFSYMNGEIKHEIDIFKSNSERGPAIGAYAIATVNGVEITKAMNAKDIVDIGKKFSKSFESTHTPWDEKNDPELWMWKKTVLKQLGKLLPKNETLQKAIQEDNKDSIIVDRLESAKDDIKALSMGNLLKHGKEKNEVKKDQYNQEVAEDADSIQRE